MMPELQMECYADPSLSALYHTLRASRRRLTIGLVVNSTLSPNNHLSPGSESLESIAVSQIAREITAIEKDIPIDAATGSPYHTVYTTLIQTHLPVLDNLGVIRYQPDRKQIRPGPNIGAVVTIAAITLPIARLLFDESVSDHRVD